MNTIHDSLLSWLGTDTSIKIVAWIPRIHDSLLSWLGTETSIKIVAWIPRIHVEICILVQYISICKLYVGHRVVHIICYFQTCCISFLILFP
jgi:DNA-binding transcriptional ArsR family regulator